MNLPLQFGAVQQLDSDSAAERTQSSHFFCSLFSKSGTSIIFFEFVALPVVGTCSRQNVYQMCDVMFDNTCKAILVA